MKKIVLSSLAACLVGAASLSATTLYTDSKGQVFTTPGEGRTEMGDFVDAKTVDMADREQESKLSEYIDSAKKSPKLSSKSVKLDFSGTHYFGYTSTTPKTTVNSGNDTAKYKGASAGFEMRRNYVQLKGYFNEKDYFRVTLDATKELATDADQNYGSTTAQNSGFSGAFVKYAYLYLDNIIPYTGVEFGIAHRPWIDYEEHNSWLYRSFNKVFLEGRSAATESGPDLVNSADLGANFKTKTDMFSSEIGVFNGEGYHADKDGANQNNSGEMSVEWRLTGHLIGSGTKIGKNKKLEDTYLNLSTYGLMSNNHKDDNSDPNQVSSDALKTEYDRTFYGVHAIYNQPEFLLAAQYFIAEDKAQEQTVSTGWNKREYTGWSVNGEIRPMKDWTIIGRYDDYEWKDTALNGTEMSYTSANNKSGSVEGRTAIGALAYNYNKYVTFIASAKFIDEKKAFGAEKGGDTGQSKDVYMFTTEVKW